MYEIDKWVDKNFPKKTYSKDKIKEIIANGYRDLFYSIKASNKRARSRQRDVYYEDRHTDGSSY